MFSKLLAHIKASFEMTAAIERARLNSSQAEAYDEDAEPTPDGIDWDSLEMSPAEPVRPMLCFTDSCGVACNSSFEGGPAGL